MERDFDGKSCCFELWFCTENFGIFSHVSFWVAWGLLQNFGQKNILLLRFLHCCWRFRTDVRKTQHSSSMSWNGKKMRCGKKAIKIGGWRFPLLLLESWSLPLPLQMCNFLCKYLGAITVIAEPLLLFYDRFMPARCEIESFTILGSLPYLATSIFPSLKRFKMTSLAIFYTLTLFENYSKCRIWIF